MEDNIQDIVTDAIIERATPIKIGGRRFRIWPSSLGKHLMIARLVAALDMNAKALAVAPVVETLRITHEKPALVARIIALAVSRTKDECYDQDKIDDLVKFFKSQDRDDLATLLNIVIAEDNTRRIIQHFKIDKDQENLKKVNQAKGDKNTFVFCGKSMFGATIDVALERYGWTYEYAVWGISWTALQLLLADYVRTVFVTDDERKKIHIPAANDEILDANNITAEQMREALNIKD